ncbi:hypothetical protein LZ32DRAFT_324336 [Colletotrichum eremochloae]|nr:hypothetical protein LZ32DRAFT_324336 [Colletotrichum eremochloae]
MPAPEPHIHRLVRESPGFTADSLVWYPWAGFACQPPPSPLDSVGQARRLMQNKVQSLGRSYCLILSRLTPSAFDSRWDLLLHPSLGHRQREREGGREGASKAGGSVRCCVVAHLQMGMYNQRRSKARIAYAPVEPTTELLGSWDTIPHSILGGRGDRSSRPDLLRRRRDSPVLLTFHILWVIFPIDTSFLFGSLCTTGVSPRQMDDRGGTRTAA